MHMYGIDTNSYFVQHYLIIQSGQQENSKCMYLTSIICIYRILSIFTENYNSASK